MISVGRREEFKVPLARDKQTSMLNTHLHLLVVAHPIACHPGSGALKFDKRSLPSCWGGDAASCLEPLKHVAGLLTLVWLCLTKIVQSGRVTAAVDRKGLSVMI